jgi:hypothetical protein
MMRRAPLRTTGAKVIAFPRSPRTLSHEWVVAGVGIALLVVALLAR